MARGIEATLQDKFIKLLKTENILYLKTTAGLSYLPNGKGGFRPIMSKKGFADIIIFHTYGNIKNCPCYLGEPNCDCYQSRTLFIEVKTDTSKLRQSQIEKFNKLKELNYDCFNLRPKHWEEAKRVAKIDHCKLSFNYLLHEMEKY